MENREYTVAELRKLGFVMTDSTANFIFVRHPEVSGEVIFRKLRERGVIVRHFDKPEICEYNRITIGSREQMDILLNEVREILADPDSPLRAKYDPALSDWVQGYGYQMWRCRHNAFRADGAYGQYILVLPDQDAVIAVTAQVRNMQAEINQIWDHIFPAL